MDGPESLSQAGKHPQALTSSSPLVLHPHRRGVFGALSPTAPSAFKQRNEDMRKSLKNTITL
ncbi:hypothetical protein, partial [Curtobacterium sp. CFBP9011]|uniref:hypothetical protein n=1 Tax=Curtobacterium sp. CFBP9011 TaxID=3096530 RepID=UPI002A6A7BE4